MGKFVHGDVVASYNPRISGAYVKYKYGVVVDVGSRAVKVQLRWNDSGRISDEEPSWFSNSNLIFACYDDSRGKWNVQHSRPPAECMKTPDSYTKEQEAPKVKPAQKPASTPLEVLAKNAQSSAPVPLPEKPAAAAVVDPSNPLSQLKLAGIDPVDFYLRMGSHITDAAIAATNEAAAKLKASEEDVLEAEIGLEETNKTIAELEKRLTQAKAAATLAAENVGRLRQTSAALAQAHTEAQRKLADVQRRLGTGHP